MLCFAMLLLTAAGSNGGLLFPDTGLSAQLLPLTSSSAGPTIFAALSYVPSLFK
jgi:hypothetical protein